MMEKQIEELISDREKFNNFVYTPLDEAIKRSVNRETKFADIYGFVPDIF